MMVPIESKSLLLIECISPVLSLFRGCINLRSIPFFLIFCLNYQLGDRPYSYRQMRRDYKIKFTDKLKANLWINLNVAKVHRLKELTCPYIVSYLHFLNLTLSWRRPLSYRNQSIDLQSKKNLLRHHKEVWK